jgi:hypothetical protein
MCLAAEQEILVLERNIIVRLLIVDQNWICTRDLVGELPNPATILAESGRTIQLEKSERVLSPVGRHDALPDFVYWLMQRSPTGDVALLPTPRGEGLYFSKAQVEAIAGRDETFLPAMFKGEEHWFLEVREPGAIEDDGDGELTYEEDGTRGPDDSIGPADTYIP